MATPIKDALDTNATGPKSVTVNGRTVVQHDLDALERLAQREASQNAASNKRFGLRMQKMKPPGGG